jgi:hypothetical protein
MIVIFSTSSHEWCHFFPHLPMNDCHLGLVGTPDGQTQSARACLFFFPSLGLS